MIGAVPRPLIARIGAAIVRIGGIEGAQAQRREEAGLDRVDHRPRRGAGEEREGQAADRQDLVRPDLGIHRARDVVGIDHVVKGARWARKRAKLAEARCSRSRQRGDQRAEPILSALIHRAWTSTGLPMRGVTTQSSTLASIQVSCTPGTPARSNPSASASIP